MVYDLKRCYYTIIYNGHPAAISLLISNNIKNVRSSRPEVFLGKGVLKISSKFTGEQSCQIVISIKLLLKGAINPD